MAAAILARRAAGFAVGACALDQAGRRASDCLDNLRAAACTRGGLGPDALAALAAQRPLGVWPEGRALQQLAALVALEQAWRAQGCQGGEDGLRDAVRLGLGYSLRCGSSGVPGAGDGVFACGDVPAAGRVLTVYAGTLWSAWDAFVGRGVRRWLLGPSADDYLLCQADGSAVDGSTHTAAALRGAQGFVSPSACGQLMNHPPEGRVPNACFVSLDSPARSGSPPGRPLVAQSTFQPHSRLCWHPFIFLAFIFIQLLTIEALSSRSTDLLEWHTIADPNDTLSLKASLTRLHRQAIALPRAVLANVLRVGAPSTTTSLVDTRVADSETKTPTVLSTKENVLQPLGLAELEVVQLMYQVVPRDPFLLLYQALTASLYD
ncbi:unnamed protein product [Prorocentrum cordatum]|uniref:Uncharacterized protein n=1 Tax=Prorocentrum cordatum TaxID=2364126 RepID=A0ABN9RX50_9DINO|nr:unnamed protein product [Polarella glacialis]